MSSSNNTYFYGNLEPTLLAAYGAPLTWAFQTEIFGLIGIVIILIVALLTKGYWLSPGYTSVIFAMVAQVLAFMIYSVYVSEISWHLEGMNAYGPFYALDRFTSSLLLALIKVFLLFLTLCCIFVYKPFFMADNDKWEYGLLLLVITLAMLILISTIDLFIGFIALEVQTITLYIMIGLKRYSNLSIEAAQKFFFFAAFSSCCFGLGLALFYGLTGTTNVYHLSNYFRSLEEPSLLAIFAGLLILTSLLFKLTLVPFHFWVGDVFQGTYGYFSSYLAIVSKLPVIVLFIKFWYWVLILISPYFVILVKLIAVFSIAWGTIYAFTELNFKRFWALTAIVNLGYIIFAFSLGTAEGLTIGLFYLFLYLLNTLFVWIFTIHLAKKPTVEFSFNEFLTKLVVWTSLSNNRLPLAIFFSFVLFSLAGLPPAFAFLPKAWLFLHLYLMNDFALLCIIFAFNVASMAYYIRLVRFVLFPNQHLPVQESFVGFSATYASMLVFIFFINLFCVIFFFDIAPWLLTLAGQFIGAGAY